MAITYTWKITTVKTCQQNGYSDVVAQVYWSKIGTNSNGATGIFNGITPLTAENVLPENFISYDQLSSEIILGWVKDDVQTKTGFEDHINQSIENQINSTLATSTSAAEWTI